MAVLYVSEFRNLPFTDNDVGQFANAAEWAADQTVAIGGTSTPSSAFNAATRFVLLSADSVCSVAWTLPGQALHSDRNKSAHPSKYADPFWRAAGHEGLGDQQHLARPSAIGVTQDDRTPQTP